MARQITRIALSATAVALLAGATALPAQATTGSDFAEHVRQCQKEMGFSAEHNPGVMHQGFSGWDPSHTC